MSTVPDNDPIALAAAIPRSKDWSWYDEEIGKSLTTSAGAILQNYSHIAPSKIEEHIYKIRDMAWDTFPWPCVGEFWFVSLGLSTHPDYGCLLDHLIASPSTTFLDLGTCLGQDLHKWIYDGVQTSQLHGSGVFPQVEAASYALWPDEDKFKDYFIAADIFGETPEGALVKTQGRCDVISIFMFLHVWDLNDQERACKQIHRLLSPKQGNWIIGAQSGSVKAANFPLRPPFVMLGQEKTIYRQSVETFKEMWQRFGQAEGVSVEVKAEYRESAASQTVEKFLLGGADSRRIYFSIKRL